MSEFDDKVLHIYGQGFWHDEATISGSPASLTKLRDAIDQALKYGYGEADFFVNDGEGYSVHIASFEPGEGLQDIPVPYTSDCTGDGDEERTRQMYDKIRGKSEAFKKTDKRVANDGDCRK